MAGLYLRWAACQASLKRSPTRQQLGGIRIGNFASFSHFWLWRDGIPSHEMRLLEVCRRSLAPGRKWVAVDVGAHLGHFTLAVAALGFDEVHAFEPIPDTYRRLEHNIAMNTPLTDCVTAHPLGVSDAPGSAAFTIHDNSPGQSRIMTAEFEGLAPHRPSHNLFRPAICRQP